MYEALLLYIAILGGLVVIPRVLWWLSTRRIPPKKIKRKRK